MTRYSFSSIIINYTHHHGYIGMFMLVIHQPFIRILLLFSSDQKDFSFCFTINITGCPVLFIGRVCLFLSIFSFILSHFFFLFSENNKWKNIQHNIICKHDFDLKVIERDTIKVSIIHSSVHMRTSEWQNRIYLSLGLCSCLILLLFDIWTQQNWCASMNMNYQIREQTLQFILVDTSIVYMDGKEITDGYCTSREKDKRMCQMIYF